MTDEEYRAEFDRVWPWLEKSMLFFARTHEKEHVWKIVIEGGAQLWTSANAAMLTTIEVYPTGLRELRGWLAGGEMAEIQKIEPIAAEWAKTQKCQIATVAGRKGWMRAFNGYRDVAALMVKEIA